MTIVSELLLVATTIGNPEAGFYPAIKMNGYTYAFRQAKYDNEDAAARYAITMLTQIKHSIRHDALKMWEQ